MNGTFYTDEELAKLSAMPKRVTNPGARWQEKPSTGPPVHRQRNLRVAGDEGTHFVIYQRQSLLDAEDFSCGIRYCPLGGTPLSLARYNGASHVHQEIEYRTHIHHATARAILAGLRADFYAIETDRYETIEGATACLLEDYNVAGMTATHDDPRLIP